MDPPHVFACLRKNAVIRRNADQTFHVKTEPGAAQHGDDAVASSASSASTGDQADSTRTAESPPVVADALLGGSAKRQKKSAGKGVGTSHTRIVVAPALAPSVQPAVMSSGSLGIEAPPLADSTHSGTQICALPQESQEDAKKRNADFYNKIRSAKLSPELKAEWESLKQRPQKDADRRDFVDALAATSLKCIHDSHLLSGIVRKVTQDKIVSKIKKDDTANVWFSYQETIDKHSKLVVDEAIRTKRAFARDSLMLGPGHQVPEPYCWEVRWRRDTETTGTEVADRTSLRTTGDATDDVAADFNAVADAIAAEYMGAERSTQAATPNTGKGASTTSASGKGKTLPQVPDYSGDPDYAEHPEYVARLDASSKAAARAVGEWGRRLVDYEAMVRKSKKMQ